MESYLVFKRVDRGEAERGAGRPVRKWGESPHKSQGRGPDEGGGRGRESTEQIAE